MRVTFESPQRLRIELDPADLSDLDVRVEELDYASAKTRRILADLLARIGAERLLSPESGRRLVEILPDRQGGCVIWFTTLKRAENIPRRGAPAVWAFADAGALFEAVVALRALAPQGAIRLYRLGREYRILLAAQTAAQACLMSEFGRPVDDPQGRATAEHGQLLADGLPVVSEPPRRAGP